MPTSAPRPCRFKGCAGLTNNRQGYCKQHEQLANKERDSRRLPSRQRGYDSRWNRIRNNYIASNPLCNMCMDHGRLSVAYVVDHIIPISSGGSVHDASNLQSLCTLCHGEKTAQDQLKKF